MADYTLSLSCDTIDDILVYGNRIINPSALVDQGDVSIEGTLAWHLVDALTSGVKIFEFVNDAIVTTAITLPTDVTVLCRNGSTLSVTDNADIDVFTLTGDNINIKGLTVDGNKGNQTSGSCIYSETAIDNLVIEDCVIDDFVEYAVQMSNEDVANHRIINNRIGGCTKNGILYSWTVGSKTLNNLYVSGNYFYDSVVGLQVFDDNTNVIENIIVSDNYFYNHSAAPLELNCDAGVSATITGNILEGGTNGISLAFDNVTVSGNFIKDQTAYGAEFQCSYSNCSGNTIENCGTGILISVANTDVVISNNYIGPTTSGANHDGMWLQYCSNLTVTGNQIVDPYTKGIIVHGTAAGVEEVSNVLVDGNLITFDVARADAVIGIDFRSTANGTISNNTIITSVDWAAENYLSLISLDVGNKNIFVTDNKLIGTTAIDHRGINVVASSGTGIYLLRNVLKNLNTGIHTSGNTSPFVTITGNILDDMSAADITAHASHKVEKLAASPTQGALWKVGEVVWETVPTDSNPPGWICATNVKTEMRVPAVVTDTTMEVDDTTGMTTGDICGVELDDGTWHWTTATVTDGNTLELAAGLAGDGAAINNDVICTGWLPMAELGTVKV